VWVVRSPFFESVDTDGTSVAVSAFSSEKASVWCAVYDESGRMLAAKAGDVNGHGALTFEFDDASIAEAKASMLDDGGAPLCPSMSSNEG